MIRQGLALPYLNPPIRSFSTPTPYYIKFHGLARLLALEGQVRESQGDWEGAVNDDLDAVLLGEKIPHGSVLLGSIIGIGCEGTGRRPLWRDVDHLNAAQARESARRLEQTLRAHVPFAETLQEEEWFNQASLLEVFRRPSWRTEMRSYMAGDASLLDMGVSLSARQQAQLRFASKKAIMSDYTTGMNSLIRFARQPYSLTAPNASSNVLVLLLLGNFREVQNSSLDNEAQNALLLTTLALHAYRLEHGAYPATLAPLTSGYLTQIPTDSFALSGPLHYKRQDGTYVLYSVGPDGQG